MGAILTGILRAILNRIFKGLNFTDAETEIIISFLFLIFSKAFKTADGVAFPKGKTMAMNYMTRMIALGNNKKVSTEQLRAAFEGAENTLIKVVETK